MLAVLQCGSQHTLLNPLPFNRRGNRRRGVGLRVRQSWLPIPVLPTVSCSTVQTASFWAPVFIAIKQVY